MNFDLDKCRSKDELEATQTMELDAVWLNPLINYMMFRAYMMDGETEQNQVQAQSYLKIFANDLQLKWNIDLIFRQQLQGDVEA